MFKSYKIIFIFILMCLVPSCASLKNPPGPPAVMDRGSGFQTMPDGTSIFVYTFTPTENYKRTIYVLPGITGINHHKEADLIQILAGEENRVVVIHPRGTGYSDGPRGNLKKIELITEDYAHIICNDNKAKEVFLFGHSMSCAMALAVAPGLKKLQGIILVNPPVKLKTAEGMSPSFGEYVKYAWYTIFAPHTPIVNMAGDPSLIKDPRDRAEAEERNNDPLLVKYFSMNCMMESKKLMDSMVDRGGQVDSPLLLIYGLADSLVDKTGCDELFENWGSDEKEYFPVKEGPHGKLTVIKARNKIGDWIKTHSVPGQ